MSANNDYSTVSTSQLYLTCVEEHEGVSSAVLQCVAAGLENSLSKVEQNSEAASSNLVSWLLVIGGALVFFMQAGFAMLCAGCVRKKNVVNSMLKNLLDACGAALAFYLVGYGLAFGRTSDDITFIGDDNFAGTGDIDFGFWFFQVRMRRQVVGTWSVESLTLARKELTLFCFLF